MQTSLLSAMPWGLILVLSSCSDPDPLVASEVNQSAVALPSEQDSAASSPPCEGSVSALNGTCDGSSLPVARYRPPFRLGGFFGAVPIEDASLPETVDAVGRPEVAANPSADASAVGDDVSSQPARDALEPSAQRPEGVDSVGFFVTNGRLYDALGNKFVLRGVNNPLVWFQDRNTGAYQWLEEIAQTGANSVRLVWEAGRGADVQLLHDAIARSIELQMIPIVELHDETGGTDVGGPSRMAEYCVRELSGVVDEFGEYLLLNLANEWSGADDIYVEAYRLAIARLREAGLLLTLMIDANGRGQRAETLLREGENLLRLDPQHNLLFSVHVYEAFRTEQAIAQLFEQAVESSLPLVVGEFGFQRMTPDGTRVSIPYQALMANAQQWEIGYLAWSWTGNSESGLNLTSSSGRLQDLTDWGTDVVYGPNGLSSTSRPATVFAER